MVGVAVVVVVVVVVGCAFSENATKREVEPLRP